MDTRKAYDLWASQYDTNKNKTRDLEALALRNALKDISINRCLEIGCGTGKNTEWLITKANYITAIDLSDEMLAKAKEKISSTKVQFKQADITKPWQFVDGTYDLITFSLVMEHIKNLEPIFNETYRALKPGGLVYVGELHPYKQYTGTKARFDTEEGRHVVECFNHHITDFLLASKHAGLQLVDLDEHFDEDNRNETPRILTIILKK
jgi:ubiquinone/menaquinone biosynthesis C-methylase UbiE